MFLFAVFVFLLTVRLEKVQRREKGLKKRGGKERPNSFVISTTVK